MQNINARYLCNMDYICTHMSAKYWCNMEFIALKFVNWEICVNIHTFGSHFFRIGGF